MSGSVSYEILSLKASKWSIEGVFGNKQEALEEARSMLAGKYHLAIKVLEERYDSETDRTTTKLVFSEMKGGGKKKSEFRVPKKKQKKSHHPIKEKAKGKVPFTQSVLFMVLVLCGILFGVILAIWSYLDIFS